MNTDKKLRFCLFTSLLMSSSYSLGLHFEPIQIQSKMGELLYAEMHYYTTQPQHKLELSLANSQDLRSLGLPDQNTAHLNFYIREMAGGLQGNIILTSLQPINTNRLNLFLKIKAGQTTYIQHIQSDLLSGQHQNLSIDEQRLIPQYISDENQISLSLPNTQTPQHPITPQTSVTASTFKPLYPADASQLSRLTNSPTPSDFESVDRKPMDQALYASPEYRIQQSYTVGPNESLWKIAQKIAVHTQQNTAKVMQQIKRNNKHAFIQGDSNRLRLGAKLQFSAAQIYPMYKNQLLKMQSMQTT